MSQVIRSLADMTAHRNRALLDLALAEALMDVVAPQCIVFVTAVAQDGQIRWLERARFEQGKPPVLTDPMWAEFAGMDPVGDHPDRWACMQSGQIRFVPPSDGTTLHQTVFPIMGESGVDSVLEVHAAEPVDDRMLEVIHSMQKVYRNMQGLLDYSERDSLTGLLNRKSFDDSFFKALVPTGGHAPGVAADTASAASDRRDGSHEEGYWVGMLDIDHFKRVNDNFGHLIGDEVLLLVARLLRQGFRFHDRLYRFGGEEFVVLMRCADAASALVVFERFRQSMAAYVFPQVGHITVSIGISQLLPSDTPTQALGRADQAVYAAKSGGRNQVINHADLVRQGSVSSDVITGDIELF
jgi:diguanylate cyclase (GGDEF)-like protein